MKNLLTLAVLAVLSVSATAQEEFDLPSDKDTPVLKFDYSGGFRMRPPEGFVKKPQLQIFPDGRVLRSPNGPNLPSSEITITQEELQSFLKSVVTENQFYEIDPEAIQAAIKATGKRIMIADAPNVDVSVVLGQGTHEVSIYAVSHASRQFPEIEALANMAKIEKLCRQMISTADLGGFEKRDAMIAKVNEKLAADHPEIPEMTREHLQYANKTGEGNVSASLSTQVESDGKRASVRANYVRKADGSEEVTINIYPINNR
jgi:hypothetical protein